MESAITLKNLDSFQWGLVTIRNQDMSTGWNITRDTCSFSCLSLIMVGPLFLWHLLNQLHVFLKGYVLLLGLILFMVFECHIGKMLTEHCKTTLEVVSNLYTTTLINVMTTYICMVTKMSFKMSKLHHVSFCIFTVFP